VSWGFFISCRFCWNIIFQPASSKFNIQQRTALVILCKLTTLWSTRSPVILGTINDRVLILGGQTIHTVKYADDLVLLAKEEKVLQKMVDKLSEFGGCNGMEMNVEKTKLMRISQQPFPVKIMIDQKTTRQCETF
jgi:hypothetical protein